MSKTPRISKARGGRIDEGLSSLVEEFFPLPLNQNDVDRNPADCDPNQDDRDRFDIERHSSGFELVKRIIEGHKTLAVVSDADYISDLIENKLLRDYGSSEKAGLFSSLYDRLLARPVLSQKWGILYLLYQLATPDSGDDAFSDSPTPPIEGDRTPQTTIMRPDANPPDSIPFNSREAFSTADLPRLPSSYRSRSTESARTTFSAERASWRKLDEVHGALKELPSREIDGSKTLPTEAALLRDLPFTLQGLSTTHLQFTSSSELAIPPRLPLPLVSLLHALAEPSLLYRGLSESVQAPVEGLIAQSLTSAIGNELRSYLALISTLEGEIRRSAKNPDGEERRGNVGKVGVTLKRCVVWTREATMGLRLMNRMVEGAKSRKGGRLISMVHKLSAFHGDPFVAAFAERILVHVTKPFYDMLRQWIYDGELSDPYHEFFVAEQDPSMRDQDETELRRGVPPNEWEGKYKMNHDMVPTFMTRDLSKKAFLIGKSLNFLRYGCGDSAWVEAYCKDATRELHYGDTATLETSIDKAYKATMARLTHLMINKFHFFEHLQALKKYLLLGQGDFIALLMECLASNLDQPAGSLYRHVLTGQLENAVRGSNAQYDDEEVLHRLDAQVMELSHGDLGWDVFSLEYKINAPINVIITPWANRKYLTLFNFLWRIKRVEFALGSTWRRSMTGARGVLADLDDQMSRDWKAARCCMAEMIHFVNQLQYYILFEVIEAGWDRLQAAITKPDCTLDGLIEAHSIYLDSITRKGLFSAPRHVITDTHEEGFSSQFHYILKHMLEYRDAVDGLYSFSVADFTRRQQHSAQVETSAAAALGNAGLMNRSKGSRSARLPIQERTDSPFPANDILAGASPGDSEDQMLSALRFRLGELSSDFRDRIAILLGDLAVQPDVNMRFLGVVMNFNNVYEPRKRRREFNRREDRKTPEPEAPAGSTAIGKEDDEEAEGDKWREGGKKGETGDSRVASRTVSERHKEKREGRDGNGKSAGEKNDAAGNPRVMSRTVSKYKEERREGSDDNENKKDERKHAAGNPRIASRTISERPNEKREARDDNGKSEGERNNAVGNPRIASRTSQKPLKREGRENEEGGGANGRDPKLVSRERREGKEEKREGKEDDVPPRRKERRRDKVV